MIEFVKPTVDLIDQIASDMRSSDAAEVWASNHHTPIESLSIGWHESDYSSIAVKDGVPLVMFGLVKRDPLSGNGVIWMLGTNESLKYKRQFYVQTRKVLEEMLTICPKLYNRVHAKNTTSITWLVQLGFTIGTAESYGPDGEPFLPFSMER